MCCTMQIKALSTGRPLHDPDPAVIEKMGARMDPARMANFSGALVWPAMLRKLERMDPGYRD